MAIPALPLFYTYAIYKRQLGALEFRANRLLSFYSFALIYPTLFLLVLLFGQRLFFGGAQLIYLLVISVTFIMASPPLYQFFQQQVNRLAYGTDYDPEEIVRRFANQIPSALRRDRLVRLLENDIAPSLLIRQSALYLFRGDDTEMLYAQGVTTPPPPSEALLRQLLDGASQYLPPNHEAPDPSLYWVRLVIPLQSRELINGIWLLGRRDPDDFYPRNDIELLQTLANQIAPVIENIELYEALQHQAQNLAAEVKKRTAELQEEKERTEAILENAGEGIFFVDPQGSIHYANSAFARLTGRSATELSTLLPVPEDAGAGETQDELWDAIHNGRSWHGDLSLLRGPSGSFDATLTLAPMHVDGQRLTGFVGVISDVSKIKEVDRLKSTIISNVSHELKTPLTNFKTFLTLLKRGKPENYPSYIQVLEHESDRLTYFITELLDLAQLETGRLPTELKPTNVSTIVQNTTTVLQTRAAEKSIQLEAHLPAHLPRVRADAKQIEQVITNLITNAINYTTAGGNVDITAGTGLLEERPAVYVAVRDTGVGIDADEIPQLFDRFFRGKAGDSGMASGTGLGLAICKEIMEQHGGHIAVESRPGVGSTFKMWLDAVPEPEKSTEP